MVAKFKVGETYESRGAGPTKVVHEWPNGLLEVVYLQEYCCVTLEPSGLHTPGQTCGYDILPRKRKVSVWTTWWIARDGQVWVTQTSDQQEKRFNAGEVGDFGRCIEATAEKVFEVDDND